MKNSIKILCRKNEDFENVVRLMWDKYKAVYGGETELELVPLHLPKLHNAILTDDFDIAHVNTDWLTESWEKGVLENLQKYTETTPPEDYPTGWPEALLKLQTFPDGLAGIPFHDGPECLIFRKDLFADEDNKRLFKEKYGYELTPPSTWDEFKNAAEFFNRPEEGMYGTLFALYPDGHNNIFDFALQVWSRGGSIEDENGNITLDTKKAEEALEFYRNLVKSEFVHPKSKDMESIESSRAFARGEAAMMVNWFGFATMCETTDGSRVKGKVDIAAVPHSNEISDPVSLNVYYTWSISANSEHKKEAWDFITNAVTRENDINLPLMGAIGCRKSTWYNERVNSVIPYYSRMEEIHSYAKTLPRTAKWHDVSEIIDRLMTRVNSTDEPVSVILKDAQAEIDILFAK